MSLASINIFMYVYVCVCVNQTYVPPTRWLAGKKSACSAGDMGLIPGQEDSLEKENGNPLQYSCLGNPVNREAWWAAVHGVTKESCTRLSYSTTTQQPLLTGLSRTWGKVTWLGELRIVKQRVTSAWLPSISRWLK